MATANDPSTVNPSTTATTAAGDAAGGVPYAQAHTAATVDYTKMSAPPAVLVSCPHVEQHVKLTFDELPKQPHATRCGYAPNSISSSNNKSSLLRSSSQQSSGSGTSSSANSLSSQSSSSCDAAQQTRYKSTAGENNDTTSNMQDDDDDHEDNENNKNNSNDVDEDTQTQKFTNKNKNNNITNSEKQPSSPTVSFSSSSFCPSTSMHENWLCLECGVIRCSRNVQGHSIQHWKATKATCPRQEGHCLQVSLADLSFWCHVCQAFISPQTTQIMSQQEQAQQQPLQEQNQQQQQPEKQKHTLSPANIVNTTSTLPTAQAAAEASGGEAPVLGLECITQQLGKMKFGAGLHSAPSSNRNSPTPLPPTATAGRSRTISEANDGREGSMNSITDLGYHEGVGGAASNTTRASATSTTTGTKSRPPPAKKARSSDCLQSWSSLWEKETPSATTTTAIDNAASGMAASACDTTAATTAITTPPRPPKTIPSTTSISQVTNVDESTFPEEDEKMTEEDEEDDDDHHEEKDQKMGISKSHDETELDYENEDDDDDDDEHHGGGTGARGAPIDLGGDSNNHPVTRDEEVMEVLRAAAAAKGIPLEWILQAVQNGAIGDSSDDDDDDHDASRMAAEQDYDDDIQYSFDQLPTDLHQLAEFIQSDRCRNIVILAGAGMSVASGIPDFRSADGLYATMKPELLTAEENDKRAIRMDPTLALDQTLFVQNPLPCLELNREFILGTRDRRWKATLAHRFIELLHAKTGKLVRLYTQNIDGLEGDCEQLPTDKVIAVHGRMDRAECAVCKSDYDFNAFSEKVERQIKDLAGADPLAPEKSTPILCEVCGSHTMKPSIVLFRSSLPERFFQCVPRDVKDVDLFIVMGTSLRVAPANSLVWRVPKSAMRVLVNREEVGQHLGMDFDPEESDDDDDDEDNKEQETSTAVRHRQKRRKRRDYFAQGDCDSVFLKLCDELGWLSDLEPLLGKNQFPPASAQTLQQYLQQKRER